MKVFSAKYSAMLLTTILGRAWLKESDEPCFFPLSISNRIFYAFGTVS